MKFSPLVWAELGVALYTCLSLILLRDEPAGTGLIPWFGTYFGSFLVSGIGSLVTGLRSVSHPKPLGVPVRIGFPGHKQ